MFMFLKIGYSAEIHNEVFLCVLFQRIEKKMTFIVEKRFFRRTRKLFKV